MARLNIKKIPGARKAPMPKFVAPQLATLVKEPPSGEQWLHELKRIRRLGKEYGTIEQVFKTLRPHHRTGSRRVGSRSN